MAFNLFMHERNIYKERPDFKKIAVEYPEFRVYAVPDEKGRIHMDFNNQDALRVLTKILLKKDFNLDVTIPDGFLIPTIPQRLNYLLWVEDLLDLLPKRDSPISGIDIGKFCFIEFSSAYSLIRLYCTLDMRCFTLIVAHRASLSLKKMN